MTLNRQGLRRLNSPKSPKRHNSSLRKKALVKKISGEVQFGTASKANLKVVVRVRPLNQREEEKSARNVVNVLDRHTLVFDPVEEEEGFFFKGAKQRCRDITKKKPLEKKFVFEQVFGEEASNLELYEATAHPLIDTLLQGFNCSVFAYGATGAGKTFTMLGQPECPGITSLTLQELYRRLHELKGERLCEVAVSYLEVYNEMVRDLLGNGKSLALQESGQQVMVPGLSLHKPSSAEELLQMLAQGNSNRSQHATDANAESSRSHAVFQIFVRQQDLGAGKSNVTISKLSMIDLAGSERGSATGFRGARFKEGSSINKSLLALGNCINALADGLRHIPYRNSKLTRLLKDSLGGNCCSVMIAAMSPASTSFEDTYNTLRYAERAKTIRTTIRSNVRNVNQHVSDYVKIIENMKEEISRLQDKVKQYEQKEEEWESQGKTGKLKEVEVVSEEELEAQRQLQDLSREQKALHQELLKLESAYRTTVMKKQYWSNRLAKVQVVAFASCRLDKTLNKCERTINSLDAKLLQTAQQIERVKAKIAPIQAELHDVQEALNSFGNEPGRPSKTLLEKYHSSVMLRDTHQLGMHRHTLLKEAFKEQNALEQLNHLLITAVRDLYLEFRVKQQCCPRVQGIFQHVVEGLDECRIAWADQQVPSEGGVADQDSQEVVPQLDADHLGSLPSLTAAVLSPTVIVEPTTSFRKSSIMAAVSGPAPQRHHLAEDSRLSFTPTNTATRLRPSSPYPVPQQKCQQEEIKENHLHQTTVLDSRLSFHEQPSLHSVQEQGMVVPAVSAKPLNTTIDMPSPLYSLPSPSTSRAFNTTVDLPSSHTCTTATPPKLLNTTFEKESTSISSTTLTPVHAITSLPSASQLSSTVSTPPVKFLNTSPSILSASKLSSSSLLSTSSSGFPSTTQLSTIVVPNTLRLLANTTDPPSASKLSSFANPITKPTITNPATNLSTHPVSTQVTIPVDTHTLRTAYSESKLHDIPLASHHSIPENTDSTSGSQVVPVHSSAVPTVPSESGPHVIRKLFDSKPTALDSTFCITKEDSMEAEEATVSPDTAKVPQPSTESTVGNKATTAAASRVLSDSHSNVPTVHEKQPSKPQQIVRGMRNMVIRRGFMMNRTPHKSLVQGYTPGKTLPREGGLRRSVSTPSLVAVPPSRQPPTTTKKKPKNMGGGLQGTSSFLSKRGTNQENVPPQPVRRHLGLSSRGLSPSNYGRSPGRHLGKT